MLYFRLLAMPDTCRYVSVHIQQLTTIYLPKQFSIWNPASWNFYYVLQLLRGLRHQCWCSLDANMDLEDLVRDKTRRHEPHLFAVLEPM